jgi:hypothetical protein
MSEQPPERRQDKTAAILRCSVCQRTMTINLVELTRYLDDGKPACCGHVMILNLPSDPRDGPPDAPLSPIV